MWYIQPQRHCRDAGSGTTAGKNRTLVYPEAYLPPIGDAAPLSPSKAGWARNSESLSLPVTEVNPEAGWDMLRRDAFRELLYADCPVEDVALAYALLTPEPRGPNSPTNAPIRTTTADKFGRIPRVYIELTQDQAVSSPAQQRMYTATPCRVLSIDSGHSAYFSQPDQLTKHILTAGGNWTR